MPGDRIRDLLRTPALAILVLGAASCAIPETARQLGEHPPMREFGRPAHVRAVYTLSRGVGLAGGAMVSLAGWPVFGGISAAAEDELAEDRSSLAFVGTPFVAGALQFLIAAPIDSFDWVLRRAWIDEPSMEPLELQPPPALPGSD